MDEDILRAELAAARRSGVPGSSRWDVGAPAVEYRDEGDNISEPGDALEERLLALEEEQNERDDPALDEILGDKGGEMGGEEQEEEGEVYPGMDLVEVDRLLAELSPAREWPPDVPLRFQPIKSGQLVAARSGPVTIWTIMSAMQKRIRRGDANSVRRIICGAFSFVKGADAPETGPLHTVHVAFNAVHGALLRRLAVIAAEDVGPVNPGFLCAIDEAVRGRIRPLDHHKSYRKRVMAEEIAHLVALACVMCAQARKARTLSDLKAVAGLQPHPPAAKRAREELIRYEWHMFPREFRWYAPLYNASDANQACKRAVEAAAAGNAITAMSIVQSCIPMNIEASASATADLEQKEDASLYSYRLLNFVSGLRRAVQEFAGGSIGARMVFDRMLSPIRSIHTKNEWPLWAYSVLFVVSLMAPWRADSEIGKHFPDMDAFIARETARLPEPTGARLSDVSAMLLKTGRFIASAIDSVERSPGLLSDVDFRVLADDEILAFERDKHTGSVRGGLRDFAIIGAYIPGECPDGVDATFRRIYISAKALEDRIKARRPADMEIRPRPIPRGEDALELPMPYERPRFSRDEIAGILALWEGIFCTEPCNAVLAHSDEAMHEMIESAKGSVVVSEFDLGTDADQVRFVMHLFAGLAVDKVLSPHFRWDAQSSGLRRHTLPMFPRGVFVPNERTALTVCFVGRSHPSLEDALRDSIQDGETGNICRGVYLSAAAACIMGDANFSMDHLQCVITGTGVRTAWFPFAGSAPAARPWPIPAPATEARLGDIFMAGVIGETLLLLCRSVSTSIDARFGPSYSQSRGITPRHMGGAAVIPLFSAMDRGKDAAILVTELFRERILPRAERIHEILHERMRQKYQDEE